MLASMKDIPCFASLLPAFLGSHLCIYLIEAFCKPLRPLSSKWPHSLTRTKSLLVSSFLTSSPTLVKCRLIIPL